MLQRFEGILTILVLLILLVIFGDQKLERYKLKTQGIVVKGIVDDTGDESDHSFYYIFSVDKRVMRGSGNGDQCHPVLNDSISIIYLPTDPSIHDPACEVFDK
jgi:hypothetical protein